MCRDRDHGGRRCPNDGAVARRNRRQNAKKKVDHQDNVIEKTEPQTLPVEVRELRPEAQVIVNEVQELLEEYKSLTPPAPTSPEEVPRHDEPLTEDEIKSEEALIKVGNKIEELSRIYGSPKDEEWEEVGRDFEKIEEDYIAEYLSNCDKLNKMLGVTVENSAVKGKPKDRYVREENGITHESHLHDLEYKRLREAGETSDTNEFMSIYLATKDTFNRDFMNALQSHGYDTLTERRVKAYRKALNDVGVEFAGTDDLNITSDNEETTAKMKRAASFYPKSWIDNSNKSDTKIKVEHKEGRAGYSVISNTIFMSDKAKDESAVHELGHHLELTNPELAQAERRFLARRSGLLAHQKKEIRKKPDINSMSSSREFGYSDNFTNAYVGRVYDYDPKMLARVRKFKPGMSHYEVLSVGMETTFFSRYGSGQGILGFKKDTEHSKFVLGLMATSAKGK